MKLLLVEDERRIAQNIKKGLEQDGYAVDIAYDGAEGYASASADEYDVIISDVMMPDMDGMEMCRRLRADGNKTPLLLLTAKDSERDIVNGLDVGADDYLAKPFSFNVLLARIRALMRRPQQSIGERLVVGDLEMDIVDKWVTRAGTPVKLSVKEFSILEYLMRNPDRVLSKNNIISHVWDFDADILPNNVEVFINLLRGKVDKPFGRPLIHTVRGFGYKVGEKA
jgi:two-component system OmpR family response regulator